MKEDILHLEPSVVWKYFKHICGIPHPSGKEKRLAEWIQSFAREHGLAFRTDEVGNTVVVKPATKGMENRKTVVLQAHLDMVPQKNEGVPHDFETDPILPYAEEGWVKATNTTLGADNGIGVAAMLAILSSGDLMHGPIETLFTVEEETGLTGAFHLKPGFITGDLLINTDSEEEGHFCIGCAGGINTNGKINYTTEELPPSYAFFKLSLKGLRGGHSGAEIHLYRGNAIKLLNRLLWRLSGTVALRLSSFTGGNVRNAIPREAFACVAVPEGKVKAFRQEVQLFVDEIRNEYAIADPDIVIDIETVQPRAVMKEQTQKILLNLLYALPSGVIRMSDEVKGVVETSTNLSVINTTDTKVEIQSLTRSALESAKQDVVHMLQAVYEMASCEVTHDGSYPGWKPNSHSPLLTIASSVYRRIFEKDPVIEVVHAGLECGIIGNIYPQMDMISIGPTIRNPHSPDERVEIVSVQKFWQLLVKLLEEIPVVA